MFKAIRGIAAESMQLKASSWTAVRPMALALSDEQMARIQTNVFESCIWNQ